MASEKKRLYLWVFFFSTWKAQSFPWKFFQFAKIEVLREKISKSTREKAKVSVIIKKKNTIVKIRFLYVKKKWMRENQKVAVKNLGKIIKCTFFVDVFRFCDIFFIRRFLYYWSKFLCVKYKCFHEKSNFCVRENL